MTARPAAAGLWTQYGERDRRAWLDCVRCFHRPRTDAPAGCMYHLDGRYVTDAASFHLALGEAVNGPGGYFGAGPDELDDCLCGNFGATVPFTLVWHHAETARQALSRHASSIGQPFSHFEMLLEILTGHQVTVVLC